MNSFFHKIVTKKHLDQLNEVYHTMNILVHVHQTWDYAYQLINLVKVVPTLEFSIHSQ
jgi:hypothetical protein